ncbi:diacylglycerol kinase [Massilia sp. PAMC28688]|uniref:diacylglycerol/lipid kinase family protein n=1 Tax=Massilia sp. PAMC28688 TaxID=2861283 RepID=UPI001C630A1D|nr:diacylglycerol kinase family protein [Massilia sp. PAMC28688]QYF92550.1 diacylglycerol kinase [Massilia sp. PAMC28688]
MKLPDNLGTAPFFIVLNAGSGNEEAAARRSTIEEVMNRSGRAFTLRVVEDPARLDAITDELTRQAVASGGILVAAGGDGTINTVAGKAVDAGCPFGVLPQGTFNYFGRAHGIPEDLELAVQALLASRLQPVQVGLVNDRIFLVNASIGLYPQIIEEREADTKQFGRSRVVALLSMLKTALGRTQYLRIGLDEGGKTRTMRTAVLFVGNNSFQMERLGIEPLSSALEDGKLAAIAPRSVGRLGMMGLMLRGAIGKLGGARNLVAFSFETLTVKQRTLYGTRKKIKVATDGEIRQLDTPLRFSVLKDQLLLMKPDSVMTEEQAAA